MRYRLRTLLILLAIGPMVLGYVYRVPGLLNFLGAAVALLIAAWIDSRFQPPANSY
jgi:hypothetical protein